MSSRFIKDNMVIVAARSESILKRKNNSSQVYQEGHQSIEVSELVMFKLVRVEGVSNTALPSIMSNR